MPVDYDIDGDVVVVKVDGAITAADFAQYIGGLEIDPRYRRDMLRLILIADDTTFPPSATIIQFAAKTPDRRLDPSVRFAFVARTPLAIGIVSMFMGNAGLGDSYEIFETEEKARAWLAVSA